jgi:lipopolysaccharide export system permease protein
MRIIDRYLLRHFIQTFVICYLSLMGLWIVIEVTTNLEEFVRCGEKSGGVLNFIAQHYGHQSIWVFHELSGFLALVSAMFTASWIQKHNEMTALMAAGIARIRIMLPIIVAVLVVSLLSVADRELLIPRYRNELSRNPKDPLGDHPQQLARCRDNQIGVELAGKNTYASEMRVEEPNFLMRAPALREYGSRLIADSAYYQPPCGNRPGGYLLVGMREPKHLETRPSLSLNGTPVLLTPRDYPDWLEPDQCFLKSDLDFDQLTGGSEFKKLASTGQLIAALRNPSLGYGADVRVAIHSRIVRPLLDITLLFLGLPLVVSRESRNVFLAMGICIALSAAFMLVVAGFQFLGEASFPGITPAMAAWAPLVLFVPAAVGLAESMWK